jgi:hypothetical protein
MNSGANAVKDKTIRAVRLTRFNVCVVSMSCLSSDFTSGDDAQDSDNDLPLNPLHKGERRRPAAPGTDPADDASWGRPVTALATEVFLGDPLRFADGKALAGW